MYDDERKILTDRLDKPVIHNRKKIRDKYRQDIQTMGQKQHISTAEDMKLREMLLSPQNKVEDTRNEKNGYHIYLQISANRDALHTAPLKMQLDEPEYSSPYHQYVQRHNQTEDNVHSYSLS